MQQEKAAQFVDRLIRNPALGALTPLQREEQIIQFLQANAAQLAPTLSAPQFFGGEGWNQIFSRLVTALYTRTNELLIPEIKSIVHDKIKLTFVPFLRQQTVSDQKVADQLEGFVGNVVKKPEARRAFTGPHAAIMFEVLPKYLEEVFRRKSYIHFELTKVQRLKMDKEAVKHLVSTTLLLRPSIGLLSSDLPRGGERYAGIVQSTFAEKATQLMAKQLPLMPEQVLRSAANSSLSFGDNRFIEATSRIAAIFAARCRNYNPHVKVDRGADTPDKSWLSTARRNYKFYGFDIKMLDEFYQIAAENGW